MRRLRPPSGLKLRAGARRLRFTREGRYFVGITLGVGFSAINTGNNLLYLILGMLLSLIILSGVLSEMSLRRVQVKRDPPKRLYAGRPFLMSMSVRNEKRRFPSFSIEVEDLVGGEPLDKKCYFLKIPAGRTQETSYRYHFRRRGLYRYDGVRISTKFPFALFRKSREASLPADILVYPALEPVPEVRPSDRTRPGEDGRMRRSRGGELHGLREYRDGDDARDVHWRTSAHAGLLMVRQYETESSRRVSLFLNNVREEEPGDEEGEVRPPPGPPSPLRRPDENETPYDRELERTVSLAASLADRLLDLDVEVELLTRTDHVGPGRGDAQRWRILATLAMLEFVPATDARPLSASAQAAERVLVTHLRSQPARDGGFDRVFEVGA